jgi:aromatic ring-opening dioxygenase catalytic subunit (LigB family)
MSRKLLPVLFLSHGGGPAHLLDFKGSTFADIDRSSPSAEFLRKLPKLLERENRAENPIECILVVSAHWEESQFSVEYPAPSKDTNLYYDYYGFPEEAYYPHLTYPVKTHYGIADELISELSAASIPVEKKERGYDHGVFIPLKVAFPEANIPIVQLSLKGGLSMREHIKLGELLRPFRSRGVLIIASGQITHNLREIRSSGSKNTHDPRSIAFCEFIRDFLETTTPENYDAQKQILTQIKDHAPHFNWCHPRPEHFVPLAVAFGAGFVPFEAEAAEDKSAEATPAGTAETAVTGEVTTSSRPVKFAERVYHEIVVGSMGIDSYIFR